MQMHLGDDAVDQVVRQYGVERVGYILANTLHHKSYTLYNKDFTERDGGILETDGDKPMQEAMAELLTEFGCNAAEGKVMDAAELREQADTVAEQQAKVLKEKLAAERPAPEETLIFYVAECLEFTFAGEFHDHLTMKEALEAYDKIPSERMSADKCIGFCIPTNIKSFNYSTRQAKRTGQNTSFPRFQPLILTQGYFCAISNLLLRQP